VKLSTFFGCLVLCALASSFAPQAAFAEQRFSFETTPGRLAKVAKPSHYALDLNIAADSASFDGKVAIDLEVLQPTPKLEINALELRLSSASLRAANGGERMLTVAADDAREITTLTPLDKSSIAPGRYVLSIQYQGKILERVGGLFRVNYKRLQDGKPINDFVLASHGEPSYMRRLVPGWDEPVYRAAYTVSVTIDNKLTAISNMPVASTQAVGAGRKQVRFEKSVAMPSYLLALFIGPWDVLEDTYNGKPIRIYATPGRAKEGEYALQVTKQVLKEFEDYFGQPYTLPKLDQIAVPGGFGGAMENWGAIYYNENALLFKPERGLSAKRRIYNIVAHEIAHQWFGNLVTMAWWDNLWLNEGFASWMASRTQAKFNPEWNVPLAGAFWRERAMEQDARKTTHPIQTPVENEARAFDVFDDITYNKGEAFIRMLEEFVGAEAFQGGITRYMAAHRMSNTTTADLWHHLNVASGKNVAQFATAWTTQPGFPKIHVTQRCVGNQSTVTLRQERFTLNDPRALALFWSVPVTLSNGGSRGSKPVTVVLTRAPATVKLPGCAPVTVDPNDHGYFRVRYDDALAAKHLARAAELAPAKQMKLVNDTFALAQNGAYGFDKYFALIERLPKNAHPAIWRQITAHADMLRSSLFGGTALAALDARLIRWFSPLLAQAGWEAKPQEDAATPQLRTALIEALAKAGDAATIGEAAARTLRWKDDAASLPAATRGAVLIAAASGGDAQLWELLWSRVPLATSVEERWQLGGALSAFKDPALAQRTLNANFDAMMRGDLPSGDALYALRNLGRVQGHVALAWNFIRERWPQLAEKAGRYAANNLAPEAMEAFNDAARADELLAWQKEKRGADAMNPAQDAADMIRLKAQMKPRVERALRAAA
jgi:aminopeptidase N